MLYQKFMPEGWNYEVDENVNIDKIEEALASGKILQSKVTNCDDCGNLYIRFNKNTKGIIPFNEVEAFKVNDHGLPEKGICFNKVNKVIQFQVVNKNDEGQYILSRKKVGNRAKEWIFSEVKQGDILHGIVKDIKNYGAFIEIGGGLTGLVYIEDLSIARIKSPEERLKIGQKVEVMIKSINSKENKISLSYKETLGTWEENAMKFHEGLVVPGIIRETEKNKRGIFIEITPNLIGMAEYEDGYIYGQKIMVNIKKIIPQKKKIKLEIIKERI